MFRIEDGKMYYIPRFSGVYQISLSYEGETYSRWVVNPMRLAEESDSLAEQVMHIWSLEGKDTFDEIRDLIGFDWVERDCLPAHVEQRLRDEESCLVEEIDYGY